MMKSIGIIAEYNPFHQGHEYLIQQAKEATEADVCISVMSGDFVQRGVPAAFNKWERAKDAVDQGVNLVVELPAIFACNSAEYFARGGVGVLEGFGCIDWLAFGSETGDIEPIKEYADFLRLHQDEIHCRIKTLIKTGDSYPKARQKAVEELRPPFNVSQFSQPNDILAVEYVKQLRNLNPLAVKRLGQGHHQSASQIRAEMETSNGTMFKEREKTYFDLVRTKVLQTDSEQLENILAAGEGLGNKLKREIRYADSLDQLIERIKSKGVTMSRVSRLLTQTLLGIDIRAINDAQMYIRVLAFDGIGAKFLKEVKKKGCATLPILTNINKEVMKFPEIRHTLDKDILASDIYHIICGNNLYETADYVAMPYVKK